MTTERPFLFARMLQVLKWSLQNLILYTFFNNFIHVNSPEARADKPLGSKFWCQYKALNYHFHHLLQKNLFEFRFYTHFYMFFPMYIYPRGRGRQPFVYKILMSTEKALSLCPFVAGLKKYLWSLILYIFLPIFIHVYSPGAGADNDLGSEFWF